MTAADYRPSDREPLPSGLIPAERLALTVARAQIERGDNPTINITTVLVMTIDRLLGGEGRAIQIGEPRPYALTRDQLTSALRKARMPEGTPVLEGLDALTARADAILAALDEIEEPPGA